MKGISAAKFRGMTLVEVMVAVLVLGIGVMGYAALQVRSVRMTEDTYARSQAMAIAQDVIERIRANVDALPTYLAADWDTTSSEPAANCVFTAAIPATGCSAANMARSDIDSVRATARNMLPTGSVNVSSCNQLTCVTVAWNDTAAASCDQTEIENGDRGRNASCVVVQFIP